MASASPLDATLAKLLEAQARLEEKIARAPAGSIDPLLNLQARWSCESLRDRLAIAENKWIKARRST